MITRDKDDKGRRYYTNGTVKALSVSVILNELDQSTTGLDYWKYKNNGEGNSADWKHLFWYKTYRGTLCHYQALCTFEDMFDGEEMWGHGEKEAMSELLSKENDRNVIYSIANDHGWVDARYELQTEYPNITLSDIYKDDCEWFVEQFNEVCSLLGISSDTVIAVERYLLNEDVGYGGQCDLLYEDPRGNVVLADLKTSSGLRWKNRLQAVAYSKAIEQADHIDVDTVDRIEVIRIHPDTRTWEIHSHEEPTEHHTSDHWYIDQYGEFEYESNEEMWEHFQELTEQAHENLYE